MTSRLYVCACFFLERAHVSREIDLLFLNIARPTAVNETRRVFRIPERRASAASL